MGLLVVGIAFIVVVVGIIGMSIGKSQTEKKFLDPLDNSPLTDPALLIVKNSQGQKVTLKVNRRNRDKFLRHGWSAFPNFGFNGGCPMNHCYVGWLDGFSGNNLLSDLMLYELLFDNSAPDTSTLPDYDLNPITGGDTPMPDFSPAVEDNRGDAVPDAYSANQDQVQPDVVSDCDCRSSDCASSDCAASDCNCNCDCSSDCGGGGGD